MQGSALPVGGRGMKEESPARRAAGADPCTHSEKTRKNVAAHLFRDYALEEPAHTRFLNTVQPCQRLNTALLPQPAIDIASTSSISAAAWRRFMASLLAHAGGVAKQIAERTGFSVASPWRRTSRQTCRRFRARSSNAGLYACDGRRRGCSAMVTG